MTGSLAFPALAVAQIPVPDIARIDAFIADRMGAAKVPRVALALVYDGAIVHQRGFGVADPSGRPMTPQTPSSLGSITKSFTALAVMQLVEAAQIDLDEPVQRYVPWFRVADAESSARITVRHLLHHTSGLSTLDGNLTQAHSDSSDQALNDRVRHLARARLIAPPGEQYRYSNGNYQALGAIVQAVTGRAYEDYVQEHILTPMGMHNSFVYWANGDQIEPATGYRFWFGHPIAMSVRRDYRGGVAQGGVFASAEDLAFYMLTILNGGRRGDTSVLSPDGIDAIQRPAVPTGSGREYYAMGWVVSEGEGFQILSHGGDNPGFNAFMAYVPEYRAGVVVLANVGQGLRRAQVTGVTRDVLDLFLGRTPIPVERELGGVVLLSILAVIPFMFVYSALRLIRGLRLGNVRGLAKPFGYREIALRVVMPFVFSAGTSLGLLVVLFRFGSTTLSAMLLFVPDAGWLAVAGGVTAGFWAMFRPLLLFRSASRKTEAANEG